jgi:hypothetical protein
LSVAYWAGRAAANIRRLIDESSTPRQHDCARPHR